LPHSQKKKKTDRRIPYWLISRFYDEIWPRRPAPWQAARRQLLGPVLKHARTVCELGCGTGTNVIEFARRGMKVYALDFSPEMCRVTRENARKKRVQMIVRQADMRTFRLPEPADLVTSEWGPINHLRRKAHLLKVAKAVARALRPGGYFYFDLHHRRHFEGWAESAVYDHAKFFLANQGGYEPSLKCGWLDMTFFIPDARGRWTRHNDLLVQIHWSHREVFRALHQAGFNSIQLFDFHALNAPPSSRPGKRSVRTMYLARMGSGKPLG
jgi:SAM-dependent methyltransferase